MDIDRLLAPVAEDRPSGIELRNEAGFHSVERLLEPAAREYRLNDDGSVNLSAPDVDWQAVIDDGTALAADGRDLRLLVMMVRAQYNLDGFAGLATGLDLLTQSCVRYWDSLHPALRERPDPKAAALPRLNALRQLENDDNGLLGDMRFGMVLNARGIGPITGDDLSVATLSDFEVLNRAVSGLSQAEKDAILAEHEQAANRVNAACRAMAAEEPEKAAGMIADLSACETALADLVKAVGDAAGLGEGLGLALPELEEFLGLCRASVEAAVADGEADAPMPEDSPAAATPQAAALNGAAAPAAVPATPGTIGSRADVERALDSIVAFYERTEPSSPIPHMAKRLRRMVSMDFMELMEEVAPSGLKEFYNAAGVDPKKK